MTNEYDKMKYVSLYISLEQMILSHFTVIGIYRIKTDIFVDFSKRGKHSISHRSDQFVWDRRSERLK